jgi:photosystem II stability/assembly factor-like uncharacterized protein
MNLDLKSSLLLSVCCLSLAGNVHAQYYLDPAAAPAKFEQLASEYESKHGRNKQFERWYWYWSRHTDADGYMVPTSRNYEEWQKLNDKTYQAKTTASQANWKEMGPFDNYNNALSGVGRINHIAFHPTNANTYWAASASGGVWKTTNNGANWVSLTDGLPILGTSDIDVNPKNPNTLYICTGDRDAAATYSVGVFKSTDGGATWKPTGLVLTPQQMKLTNTLVINPVDTNSLTLGTSDGIYKSYNGGTTWTSVHNMTTRYLVNHPTDTNIIYAAGNFGRVHRTANGGKTWTTIQLSGAAVNIATSPANPAIVKALTTSMNGLGGFYTSTDTGKTFTLTFSPSNCADNPMGNGVNCSQQAGYNHSLAMNPSNPNEVYIGAVHIARSMNGGASWTFINDYAHPDKHFLGYNPLIPGRLYCGNDGGVDYTDDPTQSKSWVVANNGLAVTQFYCVATSQLANFIVGGTQDNGTETLHNGVWDSPMGADVMAVAVDPNDSNTYYSACQNGIMYRFDAAGPHYIAISGGAPAQWYSPFAVNPHNSSQVFTSKHNGLYYSGSKGSGWIMIASAAATIKGIAMSPADPAMLYCFSQDNKVLYNNSFNPPATFTFQTLTPPFTGNISNIALDANKKDRFWLSYSGYGSAQVVEYDAGNWKKINTGLPDVPVLCLAADKETKVLYAGTSIGVFYLDSVKGSAWKPYSLNMPAASVNGLDIHYPSGTIWAATYGRGMWRSAKEYSTNVPEQQQPRLRLAIVPNPNTGKFTIQGTAQLSGKKAVIRIADYTGKLARKLDGSFDAGGSLPIETQGLVPGIYIVEVLINHTLVAHEKMMVE